jgi:hypothetical protein
MLPEGWQRSSSSAVEAFRYDADREILQLVFVDGDAVYDNEVLKPHAERLGQLPAPRPL